MTSSDGSTTLASFNPPAPRSLKRTPEVGGNEEYVEELDLMLSCGWKMELEALSWRRVDYLSEEWLPQAISSGDYI